MDSIRVGDFDLYPSERVLSTDGKPVEIGARAFDMLLVLVESPGRLVTKATLLDRVYEIFPRLKERRSQRAGTMSGGERQMLAVGRALMSDPKLLMLDEPSLGLAPAVVESMYETFGRLHQEGLTILLAEQSIELALEVADFATVLQVGKSVLSGTAAALAQDPQVQKAYLGA